MEQTFLKSESGEESEQISLAFENDTNCQYLIKHPLFNLRKSITFNVLDFLCKTSQTEIC